MHVYSDKWQPPRRVATSLYGLIHDKSIWSDHVTSVNDIIRCKVPFTKGTLQASIGHLSK